MRKIIIPFLLFLSGCGGSFDWPTISEAFQNASWNQAMAEPMEPGLEIDAFGPGIHQDKYGRPATLWPDWGGVDGEMLQIKEDHYGLGVHADQYGRPVREYPWP